MVAIKQTQIKTMKKLLIAVCLTCALALAANAAEGEAKKEGEAPKRPTLTAEQKTIRKELTEKYDADKSGKLNKKERAKMTPEDLEKWNSTTPAKKEKGTETPEANAKEGKEAKGAEGKKK